MAALDSNNRVYVKAAIEPFADIISDKVKALKDYSEFGVVNQFVETTLNKPIKALAKSYGSFFGFLENMGLEQIPSMRIIPGSWFSMWSDDQSHKLILFFLARAAGKILIVRLKVVFVL